ncbi:MAG: putative amidophosphoribosyltransferase [Limisphaerales bacterium]|jgi:predicted amidophosphoribosyltransferase
MAFSFFKKHSFHPWEGFIHMCFPVQCLVCNYPIMTNSKYGNDHAAEGPDWLCISCQLEMPRTSWHSFRENKLERQFWGRVRLESAMARWHFSPKGPVRKILHAIKYQNRKDVAIGCGAQYGQIIKDTLLGLEVDYLTAVPMDLAKKRARGYNQAEMLASGISEATGLAMCNDALYRLPGGLSQTAKNRFDRWKSVSRLYMLGTGSFENKHFMLVDDVITTGATLERCAALLVDAGARVSVCAIAAVD